MIVTRTRPAYHAYQLLYLGFIALAEQRYDEAVREFNAANADWRGSDFNADYAESADQT